MKVIIRDVLFGILLMVLVMAAEVLVTVPLGPQGYEEADEDGKAAILNLELILTAMPAAVISFMLAFLLKTKERAEALRRGAVWALVVFLLYALIGAMNGNFGRIFSTYGIYLLLACVFVGPLLSAMIRSRR